MIVDLSHNMQPPSGQPEVELPSDNPPSYDFATESSTYLINKSKGDHDAPPVAVASEHEPLIPHPFNAGPSHNVQPTFTPAPTIFYYTNARTGERVTSLLPPNHPEMICLQAGEHIPHTRYGILGILAAVFWFPLGIGLCLLDRRVKCDRCGITIDEGCCS